MFKIFAKQSNCAKLAGFFCCFYLQIKKHCRIFVHLLYSIIIIE